MKYIDLHTDALTKTEGVFQVTPEALRRGGCKLQCFAAFLPRPDEEAEEAIALADKFYRLCEKEAFRPVRTRADLSAEGLLALFSVEGGGAIEGSLKKLTLLFERGVRLFAPLWNFPNALGWPNFRSDRVSCGHGTHKTRETVHGLTQLGRDAVEYMQRVGILVDASHGSDALFFDVAEASKKRGVPFVCSHSGAQRVWDHARNLTDEQIAALADCGGVVGLCFCAAFLSDDPSAEGQRTALLAHARHIMAVGGEDVLAVGSDFDGIPQNAYMKSAADMPRLYGDLCDAFGPRIADKIFFRNAFRVLREVLR